ncbi:MAG: helix-turn-helix domain-containing protein [Chloroflexota bacterium]|nr:helix-turn-helix domain-containing protein [Chloroflexota bacterium]
MTAKLVRQARPSNVPRRPRRGRNTRRQILDASLRLFSERGFARTTVRDIARQAGITDAAIYYHFASKRDLMEALFEEQGILPAIQELEQLSTELPLRDTLLDIARRAMLVMQQNREFLRLVFMESLGSEPGAVEESRRVLERWEQGLARLLRAYMEKGQVRRLDADMAARQLVTLARGAFMDDLLERFGPGQSTGETLSPDLEAYLAASVDNILTGLLPCQPD